MTEKKLYSYFLDVRYYIGMLRKIGGGAWLPPFPQSFRIRPRTQVINNSFRNV